MMKTVVVSNIIDKWITKFKKYSFSYKDGFYQFPYIANSPQLIIDSIHGMPYVKNYPDQNYYTTNNPFLSGECHYQEIEEGLWILLSNTVIKKNITFKLYYDKTIEANYNSLTIHIVKSYTKLPKIGEEVENIDKSWTIFKAGSKANNFHFKGNESTFLNFYFSEEWRVKNINENGFLSNKILKAFFDSKDEYLYLPHFLENKKHLYNTLIEEIKNKDENGANNILQLKIKALEVINSFVEGLNDKEVIMYADMPERDTRKLYKAQYILLDNITSKFPSIQYISSKIGMSETKLKKDFKTLFGVTLLQYFQKNQIDRAEETLKTKKASVKETAYIYGYSSISAFSTKFKKIKGFPPSNSYK